MSRIPHLPTGREGAPNEEARGELLESNADRIQWTRAIYSKAPSRRAFSFFAMLHHSGWRSVFAVAKLLRIGMVLSNALSLGSSSDRGRENAATFQQGLRSGSPGHP